ncbi:MAG: hypothetical protein AAGF95_17675 [Chloroflexota bacterium]
MSKPTEPTTFTMHDPKVQQGIVFVRNHSVLALVLSLAGIFFSWGEFAGIILGILAALSIICLWKSYPVRCTIDVTTETLIVHQQRLWQHRTTTYPLTDLHKTVIEEYSLVFVMESGKRIIIGPFTDVAATAQALWTFMDRAFPTEPPES